VLAHIYDWKQRMVAVYNLLCCQVRYLRTKMFLFLGIFMLLRLDFFTKLLVTILFLTFG